MAVRWGSADPPAGEGPKGGRKRCFSAGNGAPSHGATPPVVPGPPGRPRRWPRPPPSKESMARSAADPLHPGGKGAAAAAPARRVRNGAPSRPRDAGGSAPRENRGPQVSLGSPPLSLPLLREPGETQGEADHRACRRERASAGHGRGAGDRYLRSSEASQGLPLARLPPPPLKFSPEPIANFSQPEYMEQLRHGAFQGRDACPGGGAGGDPKTDRRDGPHASPEGRCGLEVVPRTPADRMANAGRLW